MLFRSLLSISVVLAKCGSSQGYFIVLAGILTFSLYVVLTKVKNRKIFIASLVGTFFIVVEGIRAFFNSGFLAQYIYQPTITFRFDYMHAGFSMLQSHPLTGVGLDSFDDYYRGERGVISALRTGPNRIANTAHNLAMDLGANGGYPLLIAWVAIQILALISILRFLRRNKEFDWLVGTLISVWIGYLLQSLISINQIGTSVWGWIVTGCLIGLSRILRVDEKSRSRNNSRPKNRNVKGPKKSVENLLRPSAAALTVIVGLAGFSCAYPTYAADKK